VPDPEAGSGEVFSVGPRFGINFQHGLNDKEDGETVEDKSLYINYNILRIPLRLFYFIKERVAPYIELQPGLQYSARVKDSAGEAISADQRGTFIENLRFPINFSIGFSTWAPTKDVALFRD